MSNIILSVSSVRQSIVDGASKCTTTIPFVITCKDGEVKGTFRLPSAVLGTGTVLENVLSALRSLDSSKTIPVTLPKQTESTRALTLSIGLRSTYSPGRLADMLERHSSEDGLSQTDRDLQAKAKADQDAAKAKADQSAAATQDALANLKTSNGQPSPLPDAVTARAAKAAGKPVKVN